MTEICEKRIIFISHELLRSGPWNFRFLWAWFEEYFWI